MDAAVIALRLEIVRSGKPFHAQRKRADGQTIAFSYRPLATGGGVMIHTDVTEARRREAELARVIRLALDPGKNR